MPQKSLPVLPFFALIPLGMAGTTPGETPAKDKAVVEARRKIIHPEMEAERLSPPLAVVALRGASVFFSFAPTLRSKSGTLLLRWTTIPEGNLPARVHRRRSKTVPVLPFRLMIADSKARMECLMCRA
jgi:hypothetical protein